MIFLRRKKCNDVSIALQNSISGLDIKTLKRKECNEISALLHATLTGIEEVQQDIMHDKGYPCRYGPFVNETIRLLKEGIDQLDIATECIDCDTMIERATCHTALKAGVKAIKKARRKLYVIEKRMLKDEIEEKNK